MESRHGAVPPQILGSKGVWSLIRFQNRWRVTTKSLKPSLSKGVQLLRLRSTPGDQETLSATAVSVSPAAQPEDNPLLRSPDPRAFRTSASGSNRNLRAREGHAWEELAEGVVIRTSRACGTKDDS